MFKSDEKIIMKNGPMVENGQFQANENDYCKFKN